MRHRRKQLLCRKPDLVPVRDNEVELGGSLACPRIAPGPSPPTQMKSGIDNDPFPSLTEKGELGERPPEERGLTTTRPQPLRSLCLLVSRNRDRFRLVKKSLSRCVTFGS
ncbi:hypothetical protein PHSY_006872 [Pseudozyma hubeiensis SY62]|uniref:Uncharacterized protein n=1 Tax=Pseudozyma hubeiensis (strain SY62) TaxID=1305764 RepID=R9PD43_PSEHS|nr:hypothetical protein PHSY_006872 [Pseudozyma hubeiensis SY62]GAC99271.1 hypothetical protein PHSY_006872 [Pseudozyma hubeiensis SY62]